ncbi:MAG: hypothetical protein IJV80_05155 [Clostridia bacterium]|nr:hypothetical protein [Clostridia bacterium]
MKTKLAVGLLAAASVLMLGGCTIGDTLDGMVEEHNLRSTITYYANEGQFDGNVEKKVKTLYLAPGSKALDIGNNKPTLGSLSVNYNADYEFGGWYYIQTTTNANGETVPVYVDEAKKIVALTDTPVDFSDTIEANENWQFGAKWFKKEMIDFVLVYNGVGGLDLGAGNVVQSGEILLEYSYNGEEEAKKPTLAPEVSPVSECTFVEYYLDAACTIPWVSPVERTGGENRKIYVKYIEGDWELLKEKSDMNMFMRRVSGNYKYYLVNDIDCGGAEYSIAEEFKATLEGNGHTLSNFTLKKTVDSSEKRYAMFGDIRAQAVMRNITFKEITVAYTFQTNKNASLYFFCTSVENGATLENVVIEGGAVKVDLKTGNSVYNLGINASTGPYSYELYVFGSYDASTEEDVYETDEAFLAANTGISFAKDAENENADIAPMLQVPKLDTAN